MLIITPAWERPTEHHRKFGALRRWHRAGLRKALTGLLIEAGTDSDISKILIANLRRHKEAVVETVALVDGDLQNVSIIRCVDRTPLPPETNVQRTSTAHGRAGGLLAARSRDLHHQMCRR
jgi:hypothetical protein